MGIPLKSQACLGLIQSTLDTADAFSSGRGPSSEPLLSLKSALQLRLREQHLSLADQEALFSGLHKTVDSSQVFTVNEMLEFMMKIALS